MVTRDEIRKTLIEIIEADMGEFVVESASVAALATNVREGGPSSIDDGKLELASNSDFIDHSQLTGIIAYKWSLLFPDEPERGTLLQPDVELTYEYLASTGFDPNAAVRLALEDVGR